MKRVLAFASALALTVGAFAPAVFASDFPSVPVPEDNLSIWDTGSTDIENPYSADDLFDYCQSFWGDLFDDGRFNNQSVSDYQRYIVEIGVSKFIESHSDEEVNGAMTSYFDDIVNYVMSNPSDFDIYWTPDGVVSALTGNPYMNLQFGEDFYDNLYDYVIANYYTIPSVSEIQINGHTWVVCPYLYNINNSAYDPIKAFNNRNNGDIWVSSYQSNRVVACSWNTSSNKPYLSLLSVPRNSAIGGVELSSFYTVDGVGYAYQSDISAVPSGLTRQYTSVAAALSDFYNNFDDHTGGGGDPISNGKVYIREDPIGGNDLTVSFPALPVSNSKAVSNYYYETYGDTWEDNSTVINNTVYNNNTTSVYPITYENNIPLWLVSPSTDVTSYNYSLDLPSVDLQELPTEFEGGGDFFQDSFLALGGFGSFVLIAFSFGLVALFFKG